MPARTSSAAPSSRSTGCSPRPSPGAHLQEDLFSPKIAFTVLLNWPLDTLDVMVAQARAGRDLVGRRPGSRPVRDPSRRARALAERAEASSAAEAYIAAYNLWVHHLVGSEGQRPFPSGKRLLSHWNLRDQIKADYAEGQAGLVRQRLLRSAIERIVTQEIPRAVIDDPRPRLGPGEEHGGRLPARRGRARPAAQTGKGVTPVVVSTEREPDSRYAHLLRNFQAARRMDRDSPFAPTEMDRRFQLDYEIPEARCRPCWSRSSTRRWSRRWRR